ncbi:hypothetical protein INT44_004821 [Umbelopsis vinacea]|uniref:Uncharacterized protein n=1 Tax=Umbelopsis vinacea TaxID=44442 RepID=A0A8H7Q7C9_9FUNG|nr:hypothetical protein INT44_004821 [Umbelopsis vinacea]
MSEKKHSSQPGSLSSLDAMSISSPEEKLARDLQDADINDQQKYANHRVFGGGCQPPLKSVVPQTEPSMPASDDGWGDNLPSYTSISLHHRFGFQSVLTSSHLPLVQPSDTDSIKGSKSKLFGGYSGQTVVFGSNPENK